jgi:hypothetical protein
MLWQRQRSSAVAENKDIAGFVGPTGLRGHATSYWVEFIPNPGLVSAVSIKMRVLVLNFTDHMDRRASRYATIIPPAIYNVRLPPVEIGIKRAGFEPAIQWLTSD